MPNKNYKDSCTSFLTKAFVPAGYHLTTDVVLEPVSESNKYDGLIFSLNGRKVRYRKGKVTADRPGAFLAVWQRPATSNVNNNKPVPFTSTELDYLFVWVESDIENKENLKQGLFIFPVSLLVEKGIVSSDLKKGKTGFRVFPPWSEDRGETGTKVFSASGKKTQHWQLPYFVKIDEDGLIERSELSRVLA